MLKRRSWQVWTLSIAAAAKSTGFDHAEVAASAFARSQPSAILGMDSVRAARTIGFLGKLDRGDQMPSDSVIAAFGPGEASARELDDALRETWAALLADPSQRGAIAASLGLHEADLARADTPPMRFEVPRAGLAGAEVAVVVVTWVASEVLLGAFKDLAKDAIKAKTRQLWKDYLAPALQRRLASRRALGREAADPQDEG